jgi:class 3 adenylate cyclase/tetratricopeptide (TPR) repeat protein
MADLSQWLAQFGLEPLVGVLADNDVDLDILPDLTEQDFEKLGISLGHRRKLLKAIATLHDNSKIASNKTERELGNPAPTAPASEAERRQVTVLFSDLVGSTALATALDPEDLSRLIKRYQDACAGAVARFDGYIAKFMGDGVLAYFGYPQAHEDAAERSVHAALAIVDTVRQIERLDGVSLQTRVGIATGVVVVGDIVGSGAAREESIVGETPNLAARLQTLAEPNAVLISEATCRLLGRGFDYQSLGEHPLKGFAKPIPVWRVLKEAPVASRFAAARAAGLSPFVGRTQEMGLLVDRWHLAQQGEGQAIVLTAEAGMGKSRLVEALFERLGAETHRRVVLQCSPYHSNTAFYPAMRHIEHAAGFALEDSVAQKLDKLDALLAKTPGPAISTAPLLAELLSLPSNGRYAAIDLMPAQRKSATISALVEHLIVLSASEPVLIVMEDAHWIDPTTQELLTRLIDSIKSARVLAIVTARPEFASPWAGRDHVASLALSRLGKTQCAEIVAGIAAAQSVAADLVEEILAKTDGVPLFVEELTRAVSESQTPNRLAVPATLQDSLMARLDRLGPAKEVAQIAATIGRQFAHALLAAVAPAGPGELDLALERLTEASLVFPQSRAIEPTYSFKHALTRDVAYDSLLRARRRELHERIARILEERFPALATAEPEILAHHFSRADLPGPACLYSERAGDRAVARSGYAEAVAHFDAALAEVARMPPGPDRDQRELTILFKRGPAVFVYRGMQNPQAEQNYQRAYEIAAKLDDDHTLFKALWGMWLCANLQRRTSVARDRAEELVALAQRSGNDELILEAIHCRWSTSFFRGDVLNALADGLEGIKHYDPARHNRLGAEFGGHDPGVCANTNVGLSLAQLGRNKEATERIERGLALARQLNQPTSLAFALTAAIQIHTIMDDLAAVRHLAVQLLEVGEKFDLPPQRAVSAFMSGWAKLREGESAAGLQAMELEFARVMRMGSIPQLYAGLLATARLLTGEAAHALEPINAILPTFTEPGVGVYLPELHRLRGECLLRLDSSRIDEAVREFQSAIAFAKHQNALLFRLRAAISLTHAGDRAGISGEALSLLKEAVSAFTAEADSPELISARQMLSRYSS